MTICDVTNSLQLLPKPIICSTSLMTTPSIYTSSDYTICIIATYHLLIVTPLHYQTTTLQHCTSSFIACDFTHQTTPLLRFISQLGILGLFPFQHTFLACSYISILVLLHFIICFS